MNQSDSWKTKTLLMGGILGLISGLLAAFLLIQKSQQSEKNMSISPGDGVKVGLGVLGLLKLISDLGERN
ncbi:MAG: hypothetical protein Q7U53_05520 [Anaerolineaceae bacterium]|jgi:H+/Cl- antiporter ClcA|nr:hypothetical protein [Anaerolineaceae bacterium]